MEEINISTLRRLTTDQVEKALKRPVKIVTGSSRHGKRKPVVMLSEERYLALKSVVEEAKKRGQYESTT